MDVATGVGTAVGLTVLGGALWRVRKPCMTYLATRRADRVQRYGGTFKDAAGVVHIIPSQVDVMHTVVDALARVEACTEELAEKLATIGQRSEQLDSLVALSAELGILRTTLEEQLSEMRKVRGVAAEAATIAATVDDRHRRDMELIQQVLDRLTEEVQEIKSVSGARVDELIMRVQTLQAAAQEMSGIPFTEQDRQ